MPIIIHCLNNISEKGTARFGQTYEISDELSDANAILVRSASLHDIDFSSNLLSIARAGAGVNNIPLERCAKQGIVVFNTPGANANGVKELVICGLLLGSRDVVDGIIWTKEHASDPDIKKLVEKAKKAYAGCEIKNKKLGVIGLGAIGSMVANSAYDLGMDVYGYDPYLSLKAAWSLNSQVKCLHELNELLEICDYVTIHIPATPSTENIINEETISSMKKDVVFLNFSRDSLVEPKAMTKALTSGKVKRYITDFATPDVMNMPNTIVIPHLGASTKEAEENCAVMAADETIAYIENGSIINSVNYPKTILSPNFIAKTRLCVLHDDVSQIVADISIDLADRDLVISNMSTSSLGENAYSVFDLEREVPPDYITMLSAKSGVRRVRLL